MEKQNNTSQQWICQVPKYYDTLLIVKPGFLHRSQIILEVFSNEGYRVLKQTQKILDYSEAEKLYIMHCNKPFFAELCTYISSDISRGYILKSPYTGENHILKETNRWKDYFRKCYGKDEMRNVLHTSDNFINLQREASIYFSEEEETRCRTEYCFENECYQL